MKKNLKRMHHTLPESQRYNGTAVALLLTRALIVEQLRIIIGGTLNFVKLLIDED